MPTVTEEIPSGLLTLQLPPGYSLTRWVKEEKERIKGKHPDIRTTSKEVGRQYRRMLDVAAQRRWETNVTYELLKLRIGEKMGDAGVALSNGIPILTRRKYPVPAEPVKHMCPHCGVITEEWGYWVPGYHLDAYFRM